MTEHSPQEKGSPAEIPAPVREPHAQLRLLGEAFDALRDAVFLVDEQGRFVHVNAEACRTLGYSREELLEMGIPDVDPVFPRESWKALWRDHEFLGHLIETRHRRRDGSTYPVEVHATPFHFAGMSLAIGVARDISERKRAQQEREAHLRFFESMDRVNAAIQATGDVEQMMRVVLDTVLEILDVDRAFLVYPCDPGATSWRAPMERTRPEFPGAHEAGREEPITGHVADTMKAVLDAHGPLQFGPDTGHPLPAGLAERYGIRSMMLLAIRPKTGKPWMFGVHQCRAARLWTDEETRLFLAIGRRVTDALTGLLAYLSLRESEARFRRAFELSGVGMAILDLEGNVLRVNRRLMEIFAFTEAEMRRVMSRGGDVTAVHLGVNIREVSHPDEVEQDMADFQAALKGEANYSQRTLRAYRRDGALIWIQRTAAMLRNLDGRAASFIVQIEDVTERRLHESELREARDKALTASRMKSEFLANMSHEIRTPMNGIIGMATLLAKTDLSPEQAEMNHVVLQSAEALLAIIGDILDFSKIEAGKLGIHTAPFSPRKMIEGTLALLAPIAANKGLELRCEMAPELDDMLLGDETRIRQVLTNLVGNAVKFTEAGQVCVTASQQAANHGARKLSIAVQDTGPGIPVAAQTHIFEPFTQAEHGITRHFGGTGLGLAISQQLARLMGGSIVFTSAEGAGSTFHFSIELPVAPESLAAPEEAQPQISSGRTRCLRLLVAEDNRINQAVIRKMLERMGHVVEIAENGHRVLERLARERYDAVLMDCEMPECDGYTATHRIRSGEVPDLDPRIPIIALTAHALPESRAHCLVVGMNEYVTKPVRIEELHRAFAACGLD
jgi:PAS domain S-box-containing protein